MSKATTATIVGTVIALVIYFALLPVITGSAGYNESSAYAPLWTTVFPLAIVLGGAVAVFAPMLKGR